MHSQSLAGRVDPPYLTWVHKDSGENEPVKVSDPLNSPPALLQAVQRRKSEMDAELLWLVVGLPQQHLHPVGVP